MQVNAVNSLITQTPSFSGKTYDTAKAYYDDVNTLLTDAFGYKEDDITGSLEPNSDAVDVVVIGKKPEATNKNTAETGIALAGAVLLPFITGKAIVLGAEKIFPNILQTAADKGGKISKAVAEKASSLIDGKLTNHQNIQKCANVAKKGAERVYEMISKDGEPVKTMANVVGIGAAAAAVPSIVSADLNHDGIKDIAQKNVSAYRSITEKLGAIRTIVDVMV